MDWNFTREESEVYTLIPEGMHRIRIRQVDKGQSSAGNDMLTIQFDVSGYASVLFHHIVFLKDRPEITNRMLTQFFDAFADIKSGDFVLQNWIGKVGACKVKHDEYNGEKQAKVHYFIKPDKAAELPNWQEPQRKSQSQPSNDGFVNLANASDEEEIPFF